MAEGDHSGGLFSSVRRVADTCVSSVHNRVELLAVELQEEKIRLVRLLLWTGAALFAAFLAITVIARNAANNAAPVQRSSRTSRFFSS
jgi:uncharacterized membrane protein YqjE